MLSSLLVAVDLSSSSERVMGRAAKLPVADGGRLTLLHVIPSSLPAAWRRRARAEAKAALEREAKRMMRILSKRISIEHAVAVGVPASEIVQFAERVEADLIVMGRGASRPVRDAFLGSTAERVLRRAKLPALVVRLAPRGPYRRPTIGLDLDPTASHVLAMFLRIVPPPRPPLTIVHAYDVPYMGMVYANLSELELEERGVHYRRQAAVQLGKVVATALPPSAGAPEGPIVRTLHVRYGSARSVIKAEVRKVGTDLLLLGTHGHSGIAHALLGTVAGDVLREVPCDVLVVPPHTPTGRRA